MRNLWGFHVKQSILVWVIQQRNGITLNRHAFWLITNTYLVESTRMIDQIHYIRYQMKADFVTFKQIWPNGRYHFCGKNAEAFCCVTESPIKT